MGLLAGAACSGSSAERAGSGEPARIEAFAPDTLIGRFPAPDDESVLIESALAFTVDAEGLFVLDRMAGHVLRLSHAGELIAILGRPGEGPGELSGAAALRVGPDGDAWVGAPGSLRISRFRPSGELVAEYRTPFPAPSFVVTSEGRLLVPTLEPDALLAELDARGDTTLLAMEATPPERWRRERYERLQFLGFLFADLGGGSVALLRNKHADDFALWRLSIDPVRQAVTAIDSVPLPAWLYALMRSEAEKLRKELDPAFATGDFMIPFKGMHSTDDGRISLTPSPGDRLLAVSITVGRDAPIRVVVPSKREEYRGLRDAVLLGDRLFLLYETEVRIFGLRAVSRAALDLGTGPGASR